MSYYHIENLYKDQTILLFNECYAMEKIHGTSAHISYKDGNINYFAGGCDHYTFVALFNEQELLEKIKEIGYNNIVIYGEAYGGRLQKMSKTYGDKIRFVAFEVTLEGVWLDVPIAEQIVNKLGLEFVHYNRISTNMSAIDAEKLAPSVQAKRNGIIEDKMREGIVLRPIKEMTKGGGRRIIAKHKNVEFMETKTPREVSKEKLLLLTEASEIAEEWVTPMRLSHILQNFSEDDIRIENTKNVISMMIQDIMKEGKDEIVWTPEVSKAIAKQTAIEFKRYLYKELTNE